MAASTSTRVSIVIINYNYRRFVADAIESALGQTYDAIEVIVVDDGSTDDSRAVIERYGSRVLTVFKLNGGQASAFNAGFVRASGGAVIFLDADDVLDRDTAARVAAAFRTNPGLAKVHYRLRLLDAEGRPTVGTTPAEGLALPVGDLRQAARRHPDDVPYPPASGNAFAAWALERVLPMPEEPYRLLADVYLLNLVPLLGPVEALANTGGGYRVHAGNSHYAAALRVDRVRATLRAIHETHFHMRRLAETLGLHGMPDPDCDDRSLVFLTQRLVSCKLDPDGHPIARDSVAGLVRRGTMRALGRGELSWGLRLLYAAWFFSMAVCTRRPATWLAEQMLYPERRGVRSAIVERLRGRP